jgi:hypothetical protein
VADVKALNGTGGTADVNLDGAGEIIADAFDGASEHRARLDLNGTTGGVTLSAYGAALTLSALSATANKAVVVILGSGFVLPKLAAAPASPVEAQCYHNTTDHHTYVWNGTAWKQMDN